MSLEQHLAGKTVLVTGAGGLIGSRIVARLRQAGARPVSVCKLDAYPPDVYRRRFGIDPLGPDFIIGDIADPRLMPTVVPGCDYVIHAAALADVAACTRRPLDAIATATLHALVAQGAHNETVNIGTGTATTIRQVAELVSARYPGTTLISAPMPPGDPEGGYASVERMRTVLGWQPGITVEEGIARYAAWLAASPDAIPDWLHPTPATPVAR
ncbi:NAD-dependent epimerase/dehydratase family protein [Streptomyces sp. cg36]|uniref:NAD-dependent epimerase/dehydratase family protein n=1 Tax=Streptomyces sp. cg36 TaxID=3238798 RepID=UPI0034E1E580